MDKWKVTVTSMYTLPRFDAPTGKPNGYPANNSRRDQGLAYCLAHLAINGEHLPWSHEMVKGGKVPYEGEGPLDWHAGTNLVHMSLVLGASLNVPGYDLSLERFLSDQERPSGYHRQITEALSVGYWSYQLAACLAVLLNPSQFTARTVELERRFYRTGWAIRSLMAHPSGRTIMPCGRMRGQHGKWVQGEIDQGYCLRELLGIKEYSREWSRGLNLSKWWQDRQSLVSHIYKARIDDIRTLYSGTERDSLLSWINSRSVSNTLKSLYADCRVWQRLNVLAGQSGQHLAYMERVASYNDAQPVALLDGKTEQWCVTHSHVSVERSGDTLLIDSGDDDSIEYTVDIPQWVTSTVFLGDTVEFNGVKVDTVDSVTNTNPNTGTDTGGGNGRGQSVTCLDRLKEVDRVFGQMRRQELGRGAADQVQSVIDRHMSELS